MSLASSEINDFWKQILGRCDYKFYNFNPEKPSAKIIQQEFVEKYNFNDRSSFTFNLRNLEFEYVIIVNRVIERFLTRTYHFDDGFAYRLTFDKKCKVFLGYDDLTDIEKYLVRIKIVDNVVYYHEGVVTKAAR